MNVETTERAPERESSLVMRELSSLLGKLPVVGPYIETLTKLSASTRGVILLIVLLLIVYPLLSFFIVMALLSFAPSSVQSAARDIVLEALGVGGATDNAINQSNKMIDAEVPLTFTLDGHEIYYQAIAAPQKMDFDGVVRMSALDHQPEGCANVGADPELVLGNLNVISTNSSYQAHYPVRAVTDDIQSIKSVNNIEWKQFAAQHTGSNDLYSLRISFSPNTDVAAQPFFRCYTIKLWWI